jgi:hypothetical protein
MMDTSNPDKAIKGLDKLAQIDLSQYYMTQAERDQAELKRRAQIGAQENTQRVDLEKQLQAIMPPTAINTPQNSTTRLVKPTGEVVGTFAGAPKPPDLPPDVDMFEYLRNNNQLPAGVNTAADFVKWKSGIKEPKLSLDERLVQQYMAQGMSEAAAIKRVRSEGRSNQTVVVQTVDAQGNPISKIVPKVAGAEYKAAPTAEQRNRESSMAKAKQNITAIENLSRELISKRGVAQRATAMGRSVSALFGNDPKYRAYQDARMALAGNLAVLQQGSRPSDADIKAVWLPLIPDVFSDTDESAAMKWELIRISTTPPSGAPQPPAQMAPTYRVTRNPDGTYNVEE